MAANRQKIDSEICNQILKEYNSLQLKLQPKHSTTKRVTKQQAMSSKSGQTRNARHGKL